MIFLSFQGKIYFIICLDLKNAKKLTVFFSIFVLIFVATLGHVRKYFFFIQKLLKLQEKYRMNTVE